jgi:hypothetical protein
VSDAAVAKSIGATASYTLGVSLKGTTVSVTLDGQTLVGFAFNAATVDGRFGLLATGGQASFDDVTVRTNDAAFIETSSSNMIAAAESLVSTDAGAALTVGDLDAIASIAISLWTEALGVGDPRLAAFGDVRMTVADLAGNALGYFDGGGIAIDVNAAGHGWFVDLTPADDAEFTVHIDATTLAAAPQSEAFERMDLLTVMMHELGHALGFGDGEPGYAVMDQDLESGVRYALSADGSTGSTGTAQPGAGQAAPSAGGMPAFDPLYAGLGGMGPHAGIDWQGEASGSWRVELSPYALPKPLQPVTANLAQFEVKPLKGQASAQDAGFDSLGRALLGKGKTDR